MLASRSSLEGSAVSRFFLILFATVRRHGKPCFSPMMPLILAGRWTWAPQPDQEPRLQRCHVKKRESSAGFDRDRIEAYARNPRISDNLIFCFD